MIKFRPLFLKLPFDSGDEGVPVESEAVAYKQRNRRNEEPYGCDVLTVDEKGKILASIFKPRNFEVYPRDR